MLAEATYTNSAHQRMIGIINTEKGRMLHISFSGVDGKGMLFDAIEPSSNPPFAELFFTLFKSHIASERHLVSIKIKEIIKKLKIKYRVGLG